MKRWIPFIKTAPRVAVVRLNGVIAPGGRIGSGLNDAEIGPVLDRAFKRGKPAAVALVINSPGGSPVQSSLIGARIRRLAEEYEIPVYAFVEDLAASGGYWLASSADEIWIDATSIVGSIGVISASFGFHELMQRQGIERRVYTAGKSKSMLDPFRPENPDDVKRIKVLQEQIHDSFIAHVEARRAGKLSTSQELFTGDIWVGQKAVEVGLADGIGHVIPKMKALYGEKVRFVHYGKKRSLAQRFGAQVFQQLMTSVEEQTHFSRFGL